MATTHLFHAHGAYPERPDFNSRMSVTGYDDDVTVLVEYDDNADGDGGANITLSPEGVVRLRDACDAWLKDREQRVYTEVDAEFEAMKRG